MSLFWQSKEGAAPPKEARFSLWPFAGNPIHLQNIALRSLPSLSSPATVERRCDCPTREEWLRAVDAALSEIERGALQKVVLARETTLYLDRAPDPFEIAAALQHKSQGAALFCLQLAPNRAFLGASPERLFQRSDDTIYAEVVAGTRKRGAALETELLASEKDRREFQFVQDYFEEMLQPHLARPMQFSPIGLHRTANVQHLFSRGTGQLLPHFSDRALVQLLHPSPALCGTPKQAAFRWIDASEPFRRGLYGGIIGWKTPSQSDWMVAIRSCLLEGPIARIYTGTGIVAGSDPELEWEELEAKISLYEGLFA